MNLRGLFVTMIVAAPFWGAEGADWPQMLGPERTGVTVDSGLAGSWPAAGPPTSWRQRVGQGFAGPAVKDGGVILFHRVGDEEVVERLNLADGSKEWAYRYPSEYRDGYSSDYGPRAVPTISDGRVYTLGADGALRCVDFFTGKEIWSEEARKNFGAGKGFFGMACGPLVEGGSVLLSIGGANGAGVVALDKRNGKLLWKSTDQEADYSSPRMAELRGRRLALFFLREGLFGLRPETGEVAFKFRWRARMHASVNAATPVVIGNRILLTSSYGTGDNLLEVEEDFGLRSVWAGDSFSSQYATPMHRDGLLYGLAGRHDSREGTSPRCVELATGEALWTKEGMKAAAMIMAGEDLLVLRESGELVRLKATREEPEIGGRAQILGTGVRAQPALADGRFLARDTRMLVCVDLRAQ